MWFWSEHTPHYNKHLQPKPCLSLRTRYSDTSWRRDPRALPLHTCSGPPPPPRPGGRCRRGLRTSGAETRRETPTSPSRSGSNRSWTPPCRCYRWHSGGSCMQHPWTVNMYALFKIPKLLISYLLLEYITAVYPEQ